MNATTSRSICHVARDHTTAPTHIQQEFIAARKVFQGVSKFMRRHILEENNPGMSFWSQRFITKARCEVKHILARSFRGKKDCRKAKNSWQHKANNNRATASYVCVCVHDFFINSTTPNAIASTCPSIFSTWTCFLAFFSLSSPLPLPLINPQLNFRNWST